MLACPACRSRLARTVTEKGPMLVCAACGGRAVSFSVLRKQAAPSFMKKLRLAAYGRRNRQGRNCPHCAAPMTLVDLHRTGSPLVLDVCAACKVVWLDAKEEQQVPPAGGEPAGEGQAGRIEPLPTPTALEAEAPDSPWKYLPGILGLPVELRAVPTARRPVLTWMLTIFMAIVFLSLTSQNILAQKIQEWGFIPNQWARHNGMTLGSSFFLHAGWFHLLSNLYFLVIFGDNVEDHLGKLRFLLLLAGAHLAGSFLHAAFDPRGEVPCVGASAGISGVIAYYALLFPRARIGFFFWLLLRWLRVRAVWAFVAFLAVQLLGTWRQIGGASNVSYLAHLGGLAVGMVAAMIVRITAAPAGR